MAGDPHAPASGTADALATREDVPAPKATRVFSGIQPSGELHLGNWLGAVANWVRLQAEYQTIVSIVDYHAITQAYAPADLPARTLDMARGVLACGVDPARTTLFVQSHVPEHTELGWVLSSVANFGELTRMTQFKEKSAQQKENVNLGLFAYPVLQAADILLYDAHLVPVGEDQVQHLELARVIARKFNATFGETFVEPRPLLTRASRILGLDGQAKMSKSLGNTIALSDGPDEIWAKLKPAPTDPARVRRSDPGTPEKCNVWTLHTHLSGEADRQKVYEGCKTAGIGCFDCKKVLANNLHEQLRPIQERNAALRDDDVRDALARGAGTARASAQAKMQAVRTKLGLLLP